MRATSAILLAFFTLASCKAKTVVTSDSVFRSDKVATLSSIEARDIERDEVWETIVMKADTNGNLVPVSREVVRHTEKSTEKAEKGDTARLTTQTEESIDFKEEKAAEAKETPSSVRGFVSGVWLGFSALVVLLAVLLIKKHNR